MKNNTLFYPQATVNTLLDESYLVVKSVYLALGNIKTVSDHVATIVDLSKHLDEIQNVQEAANRVSRVWESIDNIDAIKADINNVDSVATTLGDIKVVAKDINHVIRVSTNIDDVKTISNSIEKVSEVASDLDAIRNAASNIGVIKEAPQYAQEAFNSAVLAKQRAQDANESAGLARRWATQTNAPLDDGLYGSKYYAEKAQEYLTISKKDLVQAIQNGKAEIQGVTQESIDEITESTNTSINEVNQVAQNKKNELEVIAGTYYVPAVDSEGNLSWTNTGNKNNPNTVNIKGEKGDPGLDIVILGQLDNYQDLIAQHPTGSKGDVWEVKDTHEIYAWDTVKNTWVCLGTLQGAKGDPGQSVNEFLMVPDPEEYFLSIYGETHGDVIGSLVVQENPFNPDPTEILDNILKG